jgi:DNA invertase Pin-like site-specific DNA recombinase
MDKIKRAAFYLRVSTKEQTTDNQRLELERVAEQRGWHVAEIYVDHGISGAKGRDKRPAFDKLCKDASKGKLDIVAAWSIDRVGRSLPHLVSFMEDLKAQGVGLYLHQQNIDSTTAAGKAMLSMCGVFAEFERSIIIERINAGLARAVASGKKLGRRSKPVPADKVASIHKLHADGWGKIRIGKHLGVGTGTVVRVLGV